MCGERDSSGPSLSLPHPAAPLRILPQLRKPLHPASGLNYFGVRSDPLQSPATIVDLTDELRNTRLHKTE